MAFGDTLACVMMLCAFGNNSGAISGDTFDIAGLLEAITSVFVVAIVIEGLTVIEILETLAGLLEATMRPLEATAAFTNAAIGAPWTDTVLLVAIAGLLEATVRPLEEITGLLQAVTGYLGLVIELLQADTSLETGAGLLDATAGLPDTVEDGEAAAAPGVP